MPRRLPNLKQLRAFEAAARHLSFKKAAVELSVSQAAISHQIKALEQYYGCRLFNRLNRSVALTEAAATLAKELGGSFDRIAEASSHFRSQEMRGKIRLSVTPFYANRMILPYLDEFLDEYPGLEIEFDYSYQIADFEISKLDGALRYGLGDGHGVRARNIHCDRVVPVASPTLVRGFDTPMTPEQIAGLPLAAVGGQERYWAQWFEAAGIAQPPGINWSTHQQRALALDFALAGNAVALADIALIRNELETGSLVAVSKTEITLDRGIHLVEPMGPFSDARLAAFGDWLTGRVKQLAPP
jgi:LysR family glycine cleavage system transcriptional activator